MKFLPILICLITGLAYAEPQPKPKQVKIADIKGAEYIGLLGHKLGTALIVDGTVTQENTKAGEIVITVTNVEGKEIAPVRLTLTGGDEKSWLTSGATQFRIVETAEFRGVHQAIHQDYDSPSAKGRKKIVIAARQFHLSASAVIIGKIEKTKATK